MLFEDVAAFADRFPRVRLMLLARSLEEGALSNFTRCESARLPEEALAQLFRLQGLEDFRVDRDVPKQVRDLAERPFWAGLLATLGLSAETGLVLLQRLVDRRLEAVVPQDAMRRLKLRFVLGELALRTWPTIDLSFSAALAAVAASWEDPAAVGRFAFEPAETLIEEARATGLVDAEGDRLVFVHPLVAALLASEAAASRSTLPPDLNDKSAAFVAALLPEDRNGDIASLLASRDIFALARALRLRPGQERTETISVDARRYADTMLQLAPLSGERLVGGFSFLAGGDESWLAARPKKASEAHVEVVDQPFNEWSAASNGEQTLVDEGYVGTDVHRAARIAAAGHGGQVLISAATAPLVEAELLDREFPSGCSASGSQHRCCGPPSARISEDPTRRFADS